MPDKSVTDFYTEIILSLTIPQQIELMAQLYDRIKDLTSDTPQAYHESVAYVEKIRKEGMLHPDGQVKTPEEFLREILEDDGDESAG